MPANRFLQLAGALTLASILLVALTPTANVIAQRTAVVEDLSPADAIVVLGAGAQDNGRLNNPSLQRTVRGIEIYQMGLAPRILMLGPDARNPQAPSEALTRARLAETMGVEADAVLTETRGLNTVREAEVTRDRLSPLGVQSILLVSGSQHLIRARPLFERAGFEVHAIPANENSLDPSDPTGRLKLMIDILSEQVARLYYRAAGHL